MIAENKQRMMLTLTNEQANSIAEVANELGITKSNLIQIATAQYIMSYRQAKSLTKDAITQALQTALSNKEFDIEQLRSKDVF